MAGKISFRPFDAAEYLKTDEDMAEYLNAMIEESSGDPHMIAVALGDIARAKGMTQMARDTGLAREHLYKALSREGNPEFATIVRVASALGLRFYAAPLAPKKRTRRASGAPSTATAR